MLPGDQVSISVFNLIGEIDYQQDNLSVSQLGEIYFPRLGVVLVRDMSVVSMRENLKELIQKKLWIKNPKIDFFIRKKIHIGLWVSESFRGILPVDYGLTLGRFFLEANGYMKEKDLVNDYSNVTLERNGQKTILDLVVSKDNLNMILNHGDSIYIGHNKNDPQNFYYIAGGFQYPGRYSFQSPFTLMDLLARSENKMSESQFVRKFYVFRQIDKQRKIIEVDARKLMKMGDLDQNIEIQGGDVVIASVEKKIHLLNKMKAILEKYVSVDSLFQSGEDMRLFR